MHLIVIMIIGLVVYGTWYYIFYSTWKAGCCGKLKFKQFKQFYAIAPEKWELRDGYVCYLNRNVDGLEYNNIYFSPVDSIKYYFWKKSVSNLEKNNENNKIFMRTLKSIQKDIDDYRKDHYGRMNTNDNQV